jgi:hypothetical protein
MKKLTVIILLLLASVISMAQTTLPDIGKQQGTNKTDTLALYRQFQAEMAKEYPVYILIGLKHKVTYIKGYQKGQDFFDEKRRLISKNAVVFGIVRR